MDIKKAYLKSTEYFKPSFAFKKMDLYDPKTITKNKFLKINKLIRAKIFQIIKRITDNMIEQEKFEINNKAKILKLMDIHEDVHIKQLSKYYQREYAHYKRLFSLGVRKSTSYNQPYYNNLFNSNLKPKPKTTDFALDFFKTIQKS